MALLLGPGLLSLFFLPSFTLLSSFILIVLSLVSGIPFLHLFFKPSGMNAMTVIASSIPIGYLIATILTVITIQWIGPSYVIILGVICGVSAGMGIACRRSGFVTDLCQEPAERFNSFWRSGIFVVLLVITLLIIPYSQVGIDAPNGHVYRAYFSGDYLKHLAITAELSKCEIPPQNPYFNGRVLHYYWMFYVLPGLAVRIIGIDHIEPVLISWNLFLAGIFLWLWLLVLSRFSTRKWLQPVIGLLPFIGYSYEGIAVMLDMANRNRTLNYYVVYNVDGMSRWMFGAPEINGIYRLLLYNMQHIIPASLFLIFIIIFSEWKSPDWKSILGAGILSSLAIGHSGFLGSFLTVWSGLVVLMSGSMSWRNLLRNIRMLLLYGSVPLLATLMYQFHFQMVGASMPLQFRLVETIAKHPVMFFILNFGVASLGILGLLVQQSKIRPIALLGGISLLVISCVTATDWGSDVAVKVGYPASIALTILFLWTIELLLARKIPSWLIGSGLLILIAPASITPIFEVLNFRDILNVKYISVIPHLDFAMYEWMRENTPESTVIQKGLKSDLLNAPFSPIPAFAQRRTFFGDWMHARIFMISQFQFDQRKQILDGIFNGKNPQLIHDSAKKEGIDYLYWGSMESESYGPPEACLSRPDLFPVAYSLQDNDRHVYLFKVAP